MMATKALQKLVGKYDKKSKKEAVELQHTRSTRQLDVAPEEKEDLAFKGFDTKTYVPPPEDDIDG